MKNIPALNRGLPEDWRAGTFLGRIETSEGPSPILIRDGRVFDMARVAPTVADLIAQNVRDGGTELGGTEVLDEATLLSPIDLQCVKACGVTFAVSALERVIEERARGDYRKAQELRGKIEDALGGSVRTTVPGSAEADALKQALIGEDLWSQYLEVAIGPDAEVFTKCPVLATVGQDAEIGVRSDSSWNNPEPEVVMVAGPDGKAVGATLGNDVNLRDFEGRSALLLGKAKDNNASCSLGPFIRLFDDGYTIEDVRSADVTMTIEGTDGYRLEGHSTMREISRDPEDLLGQAMSEHQYPDGLVLFCGTLFAPTQDRDEPGKGFTHKVGDTVTISSARLGTLTNTVRTSAQVAPWTFGLSDFYRNLAKRGLL
ncbi:fumarylacetoacetate hydrolase family protein [Novosphingobium sp. BW1]|uniref:fumarylacetoacetate hydrolase family protein n=1 Tax=Novosphingobium sp. BW1 TaxID=2592621 RepID=UPI0011DEAC30|nr:fumarylacetoacetate hydrolase family protein [Novosphingobium sp. BW1]TYC86281.1 fumarylacetoacetate hydrolase family protein [Novosphingobium sp. BW1]